MATTQTTGNVRMARDDAALIRISALLATVRIVRTACHASSSRPCARIGGGEPGGGKPPSSP